MADYPLPNKAICAAINSDCDTLSLENKLDWPNLPAENGGPVDTADITNTDVTIIFDGVSYTVNSTPYVDTVDISPTDVNQTNSFTDGIYQITVTYTTATDTYSYTFNTATLCELECKIDKLTLEVANDPCLTCEDKKHALYCALADLQGLKANLACGNYDQFEFVLGQLSDALANLNCNNC